MLEKTEHLLARHPFVPFEEIVTLAPTSRFSKECSPAHCSFTLFLPVFKKFNQTMERVNKEATRPPRVKGVPVVGNTFQFLRDTSKLLDNAYRKHGAVFRLRALWLKYTVIGGFEAKRFLHEGLAEKYLSRHQIFDAVGKQLGNADFVLGQSGPRHLRFRRLLAVAYSREVASGHDRQLR
jgi:hypothetical protein